MNRMMLYTWRARDH